SAASPPPRTGGTTQPPPAWACSTVSSTDRTCWAPIGRSPIRAAATRLPRTPSSTRWDARHGCSGSRAPAPTWRRSPRPGCAVLLEKHGLVTWGESGEQSYRATIEFVGRAAQAIERAARGGFGLGGRGTAELETESVRSLLSRSLPELRGALLADADGVVLDV